MKKSVGIHGLRHAYATHQLAAGLQLTQLQYQLGHQNIHSTLRYVHWIPRYRNHIRWKLMTLSAEELIRRFLLHVSPRGLMRIRHYGLLANRCRKSKLTQIRACLKAVSVIADK